MCCTWFWIINILQEKFSQDDDDDDDDDNDDDLHTCC